MIKIGNASEGLKASWSGDWFVINVTEPEENPRANVNVPLVRKRVESDPAVIFPDDLNFLADIIATAVLSYKKNVFVHCTAGLERSPLVVAWYLHQYEGLSLDEAYSYVRNSRPEALDRRAWIQYNSLEQSLEHGAQ